MIMETTYEKGINIARRNSSIVSKPKMREMLRHALCVIRLSNEEFNQYYPIPISMEGFILAMAGLE